MVGAVVVPDAANATNASPPSSSENDTTTLSAPVRFGVHPLADSVTVWVTTAADTSLLSAIATVSVARRFPTGTVSVDGVVDPMLWVTVIDRPPVGASASRVTSNSTPVPSVPVAVDRPVSLATRVKVLAGSSTLAVTLETDRLL